MNEAHVEVVAVLDHRGGSRWHAVAAHGVVAGVAGLRPIIPYGLLPAVSGELLVRVEPAWRRRGIGSRLLAAVRDHTAEQRLVVDVVAGSAGEAFCRRRGFRRTRSWRRDQLVYCDVHQAWLGELVDAEHPGYRLAYWTGDLPTAPRVSAASRLEELFREPSRPGDALLTAADANGDLAAYAVAIADPVTRSRAHQYGPAVLPGHRGRRLGRWVNAALIQRLREVHPHVDEIEAGSATDQPGLVAVRRELGFRPVPRTRRYELALS
ncbi:GNAT family N-acetyltransferase [Actinoplanes solisilvae]|uniref:GNAT family N-acetyltransferase n=1 Tax=Actinoplanes solisilvae TaxID=2486853 RepID=UPI000FD9A261|nr:GNAT family N-acetyltransferase [Actinoplanes solisilvae]